MRKVLLAGAFGQGNPGDEALLAAFLRHLGEWHAVATSSDPTATRLMHGCDAVASERPADVALAAASSDTVIFAGGTIFKLLHPSAGRAPHDLLRRSLALAAGARVLGKTVCMIGVGAGRLDGSQAALLARTLAYRASLLVLRDEESAAVLADTRVRPPLRIGTDAAWSLFDAPHIGTRRSDDVIVALSHHAGAVELPARIAGALQPLMRRGLRIKLQPWQRSRAAPYDDELAHRLHAMLGAEVIDPPRSLIDARETFATCALVIAFRFHATMAAASAGTPTVAYGHEPKLVGLARRLGLRCVMPADPPAALTEAALASLDSHARAEAIEKEIATAEDMFRLLKLVLDGPGAVAPEHVEGLLLSEEGSG